MKKTTIFTFMALLASLRLMAQYSPCYNAAISEGKKLFNQGKYAIAQVYFKESKDCPGPNIKETNTWIAKCDKEFALAKETATSCCCINATKMNVVYRGIDNPIDIYADGNYSATVSSGSLEKTGNGTYNLRPGEANEVTINVSSAGSSLGSIKFRVKDLPKPVAIIRNVVNGQVTKSALLAAKPRPTAVLSLMRSRMSSVVPTWATCSCSSPSRCAVTTARSRLSKCLSVLKSNNEQLKFQ